MAEVDAGPTDIPVRGLAGWVRRRSLLLLTLLALVWAVVRVQIGIDFGDGMHAVDLARRLAMGDRPLVDELNLQVLGAWPAVPVVWLWLHLVGTTGLVLVVRLTFVALAFLVAWVSWRAAAPHLGRGVSAAAIAVALVPAAYNLPVISYNTMPSLLLLLAAAAAVAARARRSAPWGVVVGVAVVLTPVMHPVTAPAAAILGLAALISCRERRVRWVMLAGAAVTAVVVGLVAVLFWGGLDAFRTTVRFTSEYQSLRAPFSVRLRNELREYGAWLSSPPVVAAFVLAVAGAVWRSRRAWLLVAAAVALLFVPMLRGGRKTPSLEVFAWLSGVTGTVVLLVLAAPAVFAVLRSRRRALLLPVHGPLLVAGLAASIVGSFFVAAMTASTTVWGATAATITSGLFAITAALLAALRSQSRRAVPVVGALLVLLVASSHTITSFRSPPITQVRAPVTIGANAGLWSSEEDVRLTEQRTTFAQACAGRTALDYGYPSAMLLAGAQDATPIVWLDQFGKANRIVVAWLEARRLEPDCIFMAEKFWPVTTAARRSDPVLKWVQDNYRVDSIEADIVLLRPNGSVAH